MFHFFISGNPGQQKPKVSELPKFGRPVCTVDCIQICFAYAFTEPNLLFYAFPVHDEKHCRINFANTVGLIFRKEMLIV